MAKLKPSHQATIDAINLLADVADDLPDDWTIELRFSNDEASLTLLDPFGDDVEVHGDGCKFRASVAEAKLQGDPIGTRREDE